MHLAGWHSCYPATLTCPFIRSGKMVSLKSIVSRMICSMFKMLVARGAAIASNLVSTGVVGLRIKICLNSSFEREPNVVPSTFFDSNRDFTVVKVICTNVVLQLCPLIEARPRPMQQSDNARLDAPTGARTLNRMSPSRAILVGFVVYTRLNGATAPKSLEP